MNPTDIFFTGFLNAGVLLAFHKWSWLRWFQAQRYRWMPDGECFFCLSFWLAVVEWAAIATLTSPHHAVVIGFVLAFALASAALTAFVMSVLVQPES